MASGYRLITGPPNVVTQYMRRLLVILAVRGSERWLMCGNYVDLQQLIYGVVQRAGSDYEDVLKKNIAISRAETCYQVAALMRKTEPAGAPTIVTDMLLRFYDEQVREDEAFELLNESILALKHLCQAGPVIVTASGSGQRPQLYATLIQNAGRITRLQEITNMGHTTPSMTLRFRNERDYFIGFCRSLLSKSDRSLFDEMWDSVEVYVPAAEKSSHPLLAVTILMAMLLDQKKSDVALKCQIEMLKKELKIQHQALMQMKGAVDCLDDDFEKRFQKLRSELLDIKYQD